MTLSLLKTSGTKVVNEANEEVILCGVGLGNWMLKEGYMWLFGETDKDRGRRIEAFVEELIGKEDANLFWETYYATYTTEQDVKIIADLGFNSIRLPIHFRFIQDEEGNFIEERIKVIDDFITWCETYNVYAILDLHGAPGGQTGANIDDSEHDFPELFTTRKYQLQTINIWKMLAKRYVGNKIVAGYDLLNEPLPSYFNQFNDELVKFYDELIAEIRAIDPDHIIILEGANWANDWSIFTKPYENVILQAHKYWNNPDLASIQKFITMGNELNCPIWFGETGENTTDWFVGSFQLQADYGIGWNLWPHKRMGSPRNPFTIKTPAGWDRIISTAKG
ncbi:MAG: glycoside hydrolase family 5 protein, partial [Turicibacter sp.]